MKSGSSVILNGEILLSGPVLDDEDGGWYGDEEAWFSPQVVREALADSQGPVTVRLNSYGGIATAGEAIRSMLAAYKPGVTCIVEGIAASAASLLLMGASRREMTAGSLIMIHDPSSFAWGTEDDLRGEADVLGLMAATYAGIYAAASGKSVDAVRAIMRAETFFNAEQAVAEGFCDAVVAEPERSPQGQGASTMALAATDADTLRRAVLACRDTISARRKAHDTSATGGNPASSAMRKEDPMRDTTTAATMAVTTPAAAPAAAPQAPVLQAPAEDAVAAERTRVMKIRKMAAPFMGVGLTEADVDALIEDGSSSADASEILMTKIARHQHPVSRTEPARTAVLRDEVETRREGMVQAMMGEFSGPGSQFRGMRVKSLAMALAGDRRSFNEAETVRAGMMSTAMMAGAYGISDFAYITTEVMNRTLRADYQRRSAVWQVVCGAAISAADFRELHAVRFGGDFQLKPVKENGELEMASLMDEGEGLTVERRGRTINLTFEAIVNDDMGAFQRIPGQFAMAARNMESSIVWSLFRSNAKLKSDNTTLFHANHKNLAAAGAVISIASVGAGRKAMWEQRAPGSKDGDDFLQVEPNKLLAPPAVETAALQFVTQITPNQDGSVNPFKSTLDPVIVPNLGAVAGGSDTAWYLVSSDLPPIQHAFLQGSEVPMVQTVQGMSPRGVTMHAEHIFGAAPVDFRGAYKNPGA